MVHHWSKAIDNKQPLRILFIDFEKAFDRVSHNLLIDKFKSFNVDPILIRWLCSFLSNRRQRAKISTLFTEWLTLNGAMSQGSWLGPLCFVSLINDLHSTCLTHKFVDDTTLSELILSKEQSDMQNHLNSVSKWSESALMKINWKKTKEMVIAQAKFKESCLPLEYNGVTIEQVSSFKLIGVSVNTAIRWNDHIDIIKDKA